MKGYTLDEKSRKTMRYNIIYTVTVPSLIFILNLFPNTPSYYFSTSTLQTRLDSLPPTNSFIFLFLLLSRIFSTLNLSPSSAFSSSLTGPYLLLLLPPLSLLVLTQILSHSLPLFSQLFQVSPLSLGQLVVCILLSAGILGVKVVNRGLRVIQDSRGFRREQHKDMRELQRLDFTMDFD